MGHNMASMSVSQSQRSVLSTIMLVEDDTRARQAVANLLRGIGHEVRAFTSAEDAAEDLKYFHPDVAILDVRLPGMFGNELALLIQKESPRTQIIFLTAEVDFSCELQNCVVLPKPLDPPRLLNQLYH